MARPIWTLRESPPDVTPELWQRFKRKAIAAGFTPTAAIGRLLRRYIDRGFDDGDTETRVTDS
jgi:hypothetical protein